MSQLVSPLLTFFNHPCHVFNRTGGYVVADGGIEREVAVVVLSAA